MNETHKYPYQRIDAMLKHFYGDDIELMIERVADFPLTDIDHTKEEIIKYLKVKQRKHKLNKIKTKLL